MRRSAAVACKINPSLALRAVIVGALIAGAVHSQSGVKAAALHSGLPASIPKKLPRPGAAAAVGDQAMATVLPLMALCFSARAIMTASRLSWGVLIVGAWFFSRQVRK